MYFSAKLISMKYLIILFFALSVSSCDYFNKQKVYSEDILKEDLDTFNWKEVDEYPTFAVCDDSTTNKQKRQCFESTLSKHIAGYLHDQVIIVTQDVKDTVVITFGISEQGILSVENIESSGLIKTQIPELDTLLVNSLKGLPEIHPAIKRSQQVKTEFKLPVVISVN